VPYITDRSNILVWYTYVAGPIHCASKNVPPLVCYNFNTCEHILIFLAEILRIQYIRNQKTLYCATSNNVASALPSKTGKRENRIFFTQMLHQCIARIQPVAPWLLQSFWLTTHNHAAVWLPKSCNLCVQLGAVGGMVHEKGSRECRSSWTVLHANACAPMRCLPERKKCHLWCVWQRLTFAEIVRYAINTVHWLTLQAWRRTTPIF